MFKKFASKFSKKENNEGNSMHHFDPPTNRPTNQSALSSTPGLMTPAGARTPRDAHLDAYGSNHASSNHLMSNTRMTAGARTPREHGGTETLLAASNYASSNHGSYVAEHAHNKDVSGKQPIYLSVWQKLVLMACMFLLCVCLLLSIILIASNEWVYPSAKLPKPDYRFHNGLWSQCTPNGCQNLSLPDCERNLQSTYNGACALTLLGLAAIVFTLYFTAKTLGWPRQPGKDIDCSTRYRRKHRRRWAAWMSLLGAALFLAAFFIFMSGNKQKFDCKTAHCGDDCQYGPAYWFCLAVGIALVPTAFGLWYHWRWPPMDWDAMWGPYQEELTQRRMALEAQYAAYIPEVYKRMLHERSLIIEWEKTKKAEALRSLLDIQRKQWPREEASLKNSNPNSPPTGPNPHLVQLEPLVELDVPVPAHVSIPLPPDDLNRSMNSDIQLTPTTGAGGSTSGPPPPATQIIVDNPNSKLLEKENKALLQKIKETEEKLRKEAALRKKIFNEIQDLKGKIRVICRARPFFAEIENGNVELEFPDEYTVQIPSRNKEYIFDRTFPPNTTQEDIWEETKDMAQSAVDGYNCCIFAYGQTGSGKTYTMGGEEGQMGVTPRMANELFRVLGAMQGTSTFTVMCYMVELYCEDMNDLLLSNSDKKDAPKLEIRQDKSGIVSVKNVTLKEAKNADEILKHFRKGIKHRHIRSHALNEWSSRSHLIFSILIETTSTLSGKVTTGKLSLVDLAGSERLKKTKVDEQGMEEAQAINSSLLELGKVIAELSTNQPSSYINKRNSKLTLLMSDSLGGNAKTMMIVCISPATFNLAETHNSLEFAARCKKITNQAQKNEESKQISKMKAHYMSLLETERNEVERLKMELAKVNKS